MKSHVLQHAHMYIGITLVTILILVSALGYGTYRYLGLEQIFGATKAQLEGEITELNNILATKEGENRNLSEALYSEQQKNAMFEDQIQEIASTVGILDKLAKTDPELLQKYSRVYFLNEHYAPPKLRKIDASYVYNSQEKEQYIHAQVWLLLKNLLKGATADGIELEVISAYRSFSEQTGLKSSYTVTYGSGANSFSADQGYSEHQLGTTIDFTTKTLGADFANFEGSDGYIWLTKNAYKFGFVLSYPKNNTYYQFEPWHWRYVGKDLARKLHNEDKFFYDLDQREIDAFLIEIFG